MSSGKSKSSPVIQQVSTPTYGSAYEDANTTATQQFTPWGPAAGTYNSMAGLMQQQADNGPLYVGPSAATDRSWNLGAHAAGGMEALANTGVGNYNFLSQAADVANNPYVQGMLGVNSQQAMDTLTRQMLPALQSGAVGVNNLGSSRFGMAQGQAVGDTQRALQQSNTGLMMNAYGAGLGAQQSALSGLGALQSAQAAPALAYADIGQRQEAYQQSALDAPWKQLQNLGASQQYLNPLGTLTGNTVATGTSGSGPQGAYGRGVNPPVQAAAGAQPAAPQGGPPVPGAQWIPIAGTDQGYWSQVGQAQNLNNWWNAG